MMIAMCNDDYSSSAPSKGSSAASTFEALHADGVDLCGPVLERCPFDFIVDLATPEDAFKGDELPLLESLGKL